MTNRRIYLAGPEVFLPDGLREQVESSKKAILEEFGLTGLVPSDNTPELEGASHPAFLIYQANRELMNQSQGLLANLTPFRGPSADVGTVFELGYMIARGCPSMAYTVCSTPYNERVSGMERDANGLTIEPFGLSDNLMLDASLEAQGGALLRGNRPCSPEGFRPEDYFDEALVRRAAEQLAGLIERQVQEQL